MRISLRLPAFRPATLRRAPVGLALAGAAAFGAAACNNDVNITDPNAPSSQTFWQSAGDAQAGVTATYNTLLRTGTGQRWWAFANDLRSDIGTSTSPWAELQAFVKFQFPSGYDFEVNREIWNHWFELISRANLVTTNVPAIQMADTTKARIIGEAKFLRGLAYFNLVTLYGAAVPVITDPLTTTDRPASADSAALFAQIERDFTEAAAALPRQLMSVSGGRATAGSAQGMLGKAQLQQRKWAAAAATLAPIVNGQYGAYRLVADYGALFRQEGNNGPESLFEVQMGNVDLCGQGICGLNVSKMIGPCGPSYCDGLPTRWYYEQFLQERTTAGAVDPRLDATLFYYKGPTTPVFNRTWAQRAASDPNSPYRDTTRLYFKKYGEYYTGLVESTWEAPINYKVLRHADVLLMYAEALNEQNQPGTAATYVNQVRARVGLGPLPQLSQAAMRAAILKERLLEFGLEGQRWLDLGRQNLFADLAGLRARDPDFATFEAGTSVVLPVPQRERNLNPNIRQNPGYR
jgi:hypothetical protein